MGPVPCVVCALLSDETQIWLGDLRVVWFGACVVLFLFGLHVDCCNILQYMATVSCP